ncbi:hypothetical protein [Ramlibacter tataouinensis]|uniref:Uncharacterized protein n=1 Tax=Ramlibacter tataouinensis (strain ATCC BAA-407 / DSM 14655 / LMG 21543 / TTB310) TaxID=365046 RepID=F5XW46_RAMTT|nr:hypothetical protein [Ramlibacter tataouinensis]AEG94149.1 hypothetical protein Rta_30390 [Ramlibacter tataouinensis TTB310]
MTDPLLCTFTRFEDAAEAQAELVRGGIPPEAIQLRVLNDEAGPTEGNFWIGNGRTLHGGPPQGPLTGPEVPYEQNFANAVWHGSHLLVVMLADEAQRAHAAATLARHDGLDVDAATHSTDNR